MSGLYGLGQLTTDGEIGVEVYDGNTGSNQGGAIVPIFGFDPIDVGANNCPPGLEWTGAICVLRNFDAVNRDCPAGQHWIEPPQEMRSEDEIYPMVTHGQYGCVPNAPTPRPVIHPSPGPPVSGGWFSGSTMLLGFNVPNLVIAGGAVFAGFALFGKKGR